MAASGHCFVEWKEQFASKERGNRVVHYFLKDITGESILAVVGTERSVRHMFYVVSEEFLNAHGADNLAYAGFRWRSRREVVNWLTSMLSMQYRLSDRSKLPNDALPTELSDQTGIPGYKGHLTRNWKGHTSDIVWSGVSWTCGKQLKHYPAFCRNGITIVIQSFVFVMAEEENHYLAYLEDMYEDRKGQKKVKVRWFHRNQEVKGVVHLRNRHPKEVFITPYAQVISAECVDGPSIVLTREHYEKCLAVFPDALLARVHICCRQFKSHRVKPFKLTKLRGYFDQPIFSCFNPDFFDDEEFSQGDNVKVGSKRTRSCRDRQISTYKPSYGKLEYGTLSRKLTSLEQRECQLWHTLNFKVDENLELLCQDSGIRGCWFRCTVLQVSRRQIKVKYHDVKDEDGFGNLQEWVPAFRLAMRDKLGIRCPGRPTIRPALPHDHMDLAFEVGAPVDAWWSDGWWEGVVTGFVNSEDDECLQVYIPSENLLLNSSRKNLRVSRDWMGDQWVDIEVNDDIITAILAVISPDTKVSAFSTVASEPQPDEVPTTTKPDFGEEKKLGLDDLAACDEASREMDSVNDVQQPADLVPCDEVSRGRDSVNDEQQPLDLAPCDKASRDMDSLDDEKQPMVEGDISGCPENESADNSTQFEEYDGNGDDHDHVGECNDNGLKLETFEAVGQRCEAELLEVVA